MPSHTCSTDGITFYCVHCIWEKAQGRPDLVDFNDVQPWEMIEWDGVTAAQIMENGPDVGSDHHRRIINADLSWPIHLFLNHTAEHKYTILDGCHRAYRCGQLGATHILAVIVTPDELAQCELRVGCDH